ncbi:MAG: immunoglobulin domain-containing protein [Verrucomicrobiota bacterium]
MKDKYSWKARIGWALVTSSLVFTSTSRAALYFWDNGGGDGLFSNSLNWDPNGNPGAADLAVSTTGPDILINGNWTVDSLRLEAGGSATQSSGTLTIASGGDPGLWICENGPGTATYTLNGGAIVLNDGADDFDIGRNNGTVAYFNMNGGSVTNNGTGNAFFVARFGGSYGQVNMTGGVLNGPNADTHIGLDGAAAWFQSGGTFNCAGLQIGRFASPFAYVELSGSAKWNAGLVLLADGHGVFNPPNSGPVDLKIIGTNVTFNSSGLVVRTYGSVTFDGQGVGVSTLHLGNGILLLQNASLVLNNLPNATATNQTLVLMDQIGSYPGPDVQFANAPDGSVFDGGSFSWQIKYQGTNIVLVSAPLCVAPSISFQPQSQTVVVSNSVTFTVGAGGSDLLYQWQTNGVDIAGANGSSYTINEVHNSDALTYRVKVSNVCSGVTVTSSNATLTVLPPHEFITWTDAGGNNLYSNSNNWDLARVPDAGDFAFVNGNTNVLVINGDFAVDTMRTGGGTSVLHTNGTLTIFNGAWTDLGLYVGDNGDNGGVSTYTLNGGTIQVQDPDGFQVGRNGSAVSTFTFVSGNITNLAGDTHIGLDGDATWNQSGGVLKAGGVQIGRFASPHSIARLTGNAVWDVGLVLLADGHGVFSPRNTNDVFLTLVGPNISYKSTGLVLQNEGKVTFDGTGGGVSTMDFGGGQFLLNYGQLFLTNLPTVQSNGQQIVLMKNIGAYTGANTQFVNAPNGTTYGGWQLSYQGSPATNIVLVALPLIKFTTATAGGGNVTMQFTAGTSDTTASFVVQSAATANGPYADVSPAAAISQLSPGNFQAIVPTNGPNRFYRVRR